MRKVIAFEQVSLDGYFTDANGDMSWAHKQDPEWNAFVGSNASGEGTLLFGRVTYEMMASFWPTPAAMERAPAVAEGMNKMPKVVFSRTLEKASWKNTKLLKGDIAAEVRKMKKEPGPDMAILGSGSIASQLAQEGLSDEFQIVVNPIVLGKGKTLRADGVNEGDAQARRTAGAVARRSYGKLVAFLAARTRDVAAAEDALSEAFARALSDWPGNGCPSNPEAWLLTVARRRVIDVARRRGRGEAATGQLQLLTEGLDAAAAEAEIPDRRLALMFACAHPAIEAGVRAPLMLQVVVGLDAKMIASAFLMSPAAIGKRLVRAKNRIRQAGIPFSIPEREELPGRLDTVLDAIYAAFAEGWADPGGTDVVRRDLTDEALFLARLVAELLPEEPEALGLLALMLHAEARRRARRNGDGEYVPLADQDPARWDGQMIGEAEGLLRRASARGSIGRYQLEGALQSAHVYRRRTGHANWAAVVQLYDALWVLTGSPVVAINRALAIAELQDARSGLEAMQEVAGDVRLAGYEPYWAARAELLAKTGAHGEARRAYEIAIGLERDPAVRRFLQGRQSALPA